MKFTKFKIRNFKGIKSLDLELDKNPIGKLITLIGLNESGKTTVLEALNYFSYKPEKLDDLNLHGTGPVDVHSIIPISKRGIFTGNISIEVHIDFDPHDLDNTKSYALSEHGFVITSPISKLIIHQVYPFNNSEFDSKKRMNYWTYTLIGHHKNSKKKTTSLGANSQIWQSITKHISSRIPAILYFPSFLSEIPDRIYISDNNDEPASYYSKIIQDILTSIDETLSISKHVTERLQGGSSRELKNLDGLLLQMSNVVTRSIIDHWAGVFGLNMRNRSVVFNAGIEPSKKIYFEIKIRDSDGYYAIAERSLGFRWFFGFVLLIGFRSFRRSSLPNPIYLLDEPAANLHPAAQLKVRDILEEFSKSATIIYATHSHHLINPKWLESAYIVRNKGSNEDGSIHIDDATDIEIVRYREFVSKNPSLTSYFRPVLDVLDYLPSELEFTAPSVFVEGKNDYYCYRYVFDHILNLKSNWRIVPASGSSAMDALVGWYIGWAKDFCIILDADEEGRKQKKRYIEEFGPAMEGRIWLLSDINPAWAGTALEQLFSTADRNDIQNACFPGTAFEKALFNRAIQQLLMTGTKVPITDNSKTNFRDCFAFIEAQFIEI